MGRKKKSGRPRRKLYGLEPTRFYTHAELYDLQGWTYYTLKKWRGMGLPFSQTQPPTSPIMYLGQDLIDFVNELQQSQ